MPVTISVLMAIYNEEKYLHEAIDSILNQTFSDFEFIIVNDASTDNSSAVLRSYNDLRIKIINNLKNLGLTNSLNIGLSLAKGRYVARMDGDDISMPDRLKKQVDFLDAHPDAGFVGTSAIQIDESGNKIVEFPLETDSKKLKRELLVNNQFCHGSVMFRRKAIDDAGAYRQEFKFAQDYDIYLRISDNYEVGNLVDSLYKWRLDPASISISKKSGQDMYVDLARKCARLRREGKDDSLELRIEEIKKSKNPDSNEEQIALAWYYYNWGRALCGQARMLEARAILKKAASLSRNSLEIKVFYLATYLPLSFLKAARAVLYKIKK